MNEAFLSKLHEKDERILFLEIELERARERELRLQERLNAALASLATRQPPLPLSDKAQRRAAKEDELSKLLIEGTLTRGEYESRLDFFDYHEAKNEEEEYWNSLYPYDY
jgi:hypothetical protein